MSAPRRVVHFGIDGGDFRVLDALAARGIMPEYTALRGDAGRAVLLSTIPWFTVPGWVTWMTGVAAERHGLIYWTAASAHDHWERRGAATRFVEFGDIGFPTVFGILSAAGIAVASVNMPVTFPPPALQRGVMVSGYLAPSDPNRITHPRGFLRRYPDYRVDTEGPAGAVGLPTEDSSSMSEKELTEYAERLTAMAEARHRVMLDLLEDGLGLTSVVYVGPDRLSHVAWPQVRALLDRPPGNPVERAVERYYSTLDRLLGATRRAASDALFLVTSDHGQGPPPTRVLSPNVWLRERGWVVSRAGSVRRSAHLVAWPALRRRVWRIWRRSRNIPKGSLPFVDWERTVAYAVGLGPCQAFGVAVRGGRGLQEEVAASLQSLVDPDTGAAPVERVVFADDICEAPARARYPDLIVLMRHDYRAVTGRVDGALFRPAPERPSGYHEREGVLMAVGSDVVPGEYPTASIADVAPTILSTLGIRPPDDMDGSLISWISRRRDDLVIVEAATEQGAGPGRTEEDERLIASHLRDLGYID